MSTGAHNPARRTARALPHIDTARCTGCGWCVAVCAPHVLSLHSADGHKASVLHEPAGCTGCALCAVRCPFGVIEMRRRPPDGGATAPAKQS